MILVTTTTPVLARPANINLGEEVDAYINETMKRLPIPGIAVGIVKDDKVLYLQGYGTANVDGDPVTPQTPFMLASVTKSFTALAVHQLADAGRVDLDRPVQTYLPEFRLGNAQFAASITVRHLLDHTSGISTMAGTEPYLHSPATTFDEALHKLARYNPKQKPGEQYEYSNWNYVLLGEIISRASGMPFAEYMQTNILDPLEMTQASFADYHTLPGVATSNLIVLGMPVPYDEKYIPVMLSAGYLTASAEDMVHYLIPYFNQGQYHDHSLLPAQGRGWYNVTWNWQPGYPANINYGFSGGNNSINTNIQLFPLHKLGVVVLMNTRLDGMFPAPSANEIAFNIGRIVNNLPCDLPSNRGFYGTYILLDGFLALMVASIVWQASHLKNKPNSKPVNVRIGIIFDLLLSIAIFILPIVLKTRWHIILYHRPETTFPLLIIGVSLGVLGLIKLLRNKNETE